MVIAVALHLLCSYSYKGGVWKSVLVVLVSRRRISVDSMRPTLSVRVVLVSTSLVLVL